MANLRAILRNSGVAAVLALPTLAAAAARDYRFDTVHTQVLVSASHLGYSQSTGRLRVKSGFIRFDADDWSTAQVDVLIDTASIDMGDAQWNDKLRSDEFLATARYPTARYVSTRAEKTGDNKGIVHGNLSLLGKTRPVDLDVAFNRAGADPYTFKWTAGFSATAHLRRADFGMSKYLPDVGDVVSIRIEAEGLRDRDAQDKSAGADATRTPG